MPVSRRYRSLRNFGDQTEPVVARHNGDGVASGTPTPFNHNPDLGPPTSIRIRCGAGVWAAPQIRQRHCDMADPAWRRIGWPTKWGRSTTVTAEPAKTSIFNGQRGRKRRQFCPQTSAPPVDTSATFQTNPAESRPNGPIDPGRLARRHRWEPLRRLPISSQSVRPGATHCTVRKSRSPMMGLSWSIRCGGPATAATGCLHRSKPCLRQDLQPGDALLRPGNQRRPRNRSASNSPRLPKRWTAVSRDVDENQDAHERRIRLLW